MVGRMSRVVLGRSRKSQRYYILTGFTGKSLMQCRRSNGGDVAWKDFPFSGTELPHWSAVRKNASLTGERRYIQAA